MPDLDLDDVYLRWDMQGLIPLVSDDDPYHFIQFVNGQITIPADGEDVDLEAPDRLIGRFRLMIVDVDGASENRLDPFDVFDCDAEACNVYEAVFDSEDGFFNKNVLNAVRDINYSRNVLILDRLGIVPEFRGHRLGLLVLRKLIQRFGNSVGLVALDPVPFAYSETIHKTGDWSHREIDESDPETEKLRAYYRHLGFHELPVTSVMVLSPAFELPAVRQLLRKKL